MKIEPKRKLKNNLFYNNICLILAVFSVIFLVTSFVIGNSVIQKKTYSNLQEGSTYGPIKVTNKPKVARIKASFHGNNTGTYISCEVQDEDRDTLYEFGKDLWHEDGYDSEGYYSESERNMTADLAFTEKGTYYIQFNTDENSMYLIQMEIQLKKGSEIPHLQVGILLLLVSVLGFCISNWKQVKTMLANANDWVEEYCD